MLMRRFVSCAVVRKMTALLSRTLRSLDTDTPWSEFASELYRPNDRRLSAKRLPTCADRGATWSA
jgi:hypothetical protein